MSAKKREKVLEQLTSVQSRREVAERPDRWFAGLSVRDAQVVARHLATLADERLPLRLGVIHTYTSDLLDPWLNLHAAVQGLELHAYHAPYGLNLLEAQADSGLAQHAPDITLFMLQRQDLHPDLARPVTGLAADDRQRLQMEIIDRLSQVLSQFRKTVSGLMLVSLLPPVQGASLGQLDRHAERSEGAWWHDLRERMAGHLRDNIDAAILLDEDQLIGQVGRDQFLDRRYWYASRFPFTPQAANEFARIIVNFGVLLKRPKAKVIVLDADNTLWGGIIGEDGLHGIGLGQDYPGNAYVDFQRRLLDFQQRGFVLALCSKNNPADLQEVLDKHPHQVLRDDHFVARRVNWEPKPSNIRALAQELNLGLDSFIFVDDSDHECAMVRQELPQVEVIQTPKNPVAVPTCLEQVARLEILSLTDEDLSKTQMYSQERQRRELRQSLDGQGEDITAYLRSLGMKLSIQLNPAAHVARLSQLSQKTNQFNLTTRRYDEQQVADFIASPDWTVASFSLADVFGDSGIVGMMLVRHPSDETEPAAIDTLLMSCRVIGRRAESAFLYAVLHHLAAAGIKRISAEYLPTAKNKLVERFFDDHGFQDVGDKRYACELGSAQQAALQDLPIDVTVD
jgi:FkbH-like protein